MDGVMGTHGVTSTKLTTESTNTKSRDLARRQEIRRKYLFPLFHFLSSFQIVVPFFLFISRPPPTPPLSVLEIVRV